MTCHDEYLLPTLIQGVDGVLVGFASFVPDLIVALARAVEENHLAEAVEVYDRISAFRRAVYRLEEPSGASHARMKEALYERGLIASPIARPPVTPLTATEKEEIRAGLTECDSLPRMSERVRATA